MLLEKTQRRLCRVLFVAGCVLPTLAVAGFTTNRLRPSFDDTLLLAASEALGVTLECDEITTPRPHVYELTGLRAIDPTTDNLLIACKHIRLQEVEATWRLVAEGATVSPEGVDANWLAGLLDGTLNVEGKLTNVQLSEASTVESLSMRLASNSHGARQFSLQGPEQARLHATRTEHSVHFEADTAGQAVPAQWLGDWPLAFVCNASTRFTGTNNCEWREETRSTLGTAKGLLETQQVTAEGLTADRGTLDIESIQWSGGRVDLLEGRLNLRDGCLSRSVVWGACEHLGASPFETLNALWLDPTTSEKIPFTQLACKVELGPEGLTLVAGCDEIDGHFRGGAAAHSIVTLNGKPLLREPTVRPLPTQRLVRAWFPGQQAELPATAAAVEMMRALPAGE